MDESDLDKLTKKTLTAGSELSSDHPGFHDGTYRQRRQEIAAISEKYSSVSSDRLPHVDYNEAEHQVWRTVYGKLRWLFPDRACREYNAALRSLESSE